MAFIRWNQTTNIWEIAADETNPSTPWNHLPVQNPTLPLDTANKAYVDSKISGGPFVPYTGATANVNLGAFNLFAGRGVFGGFDYGHPLSVHNVATSLLVNPNNNISNFYSIGDTTSVYTYLDFYTRNGSAADVLNFRIGVSSIRSYGAIYEHNRSLPMGDWQGWTPAWKSYLGTDGVIGNGYIVARYSIVGRTVFYTIQLGIGSTTVIPSGYWMFVLPIPAANTAIEGSAHAYDGTSGAILQAGLIPGGYFFGISSSVGIISGSIASPANNFFRYDLPWTWKPNDSLFLSGHYEI